MTFITVNAAQVLRTVCFKFSILMVGVLLFQSTASAEWLTVEMEGAREDVHLDTETGALYVGSDCTPLLYFQEQPSNRSKMLNKSGKAYLVLQNRSRKAAKSSGPSRLPSEIVINGDTVQVISESIAGRVISKGSVKPIVLAGRKKSTQCK